MSDHPPTRGWPDSSVPTASQKPTGHRNIARLPSDRLGTAVWRFREIVTVDAGGPCS